MRNVIIIFSLLLFISCTNQQTEKQSINTTPTKQDTTKVQQTISSPTKNTAQLDNVITDRFLKFVKFLDSSGFIFDTTRFKKTYEYDGYSKDAKVYSIENYIFYDIAVKQTIPYKHLRRCENDTSEQTKEWCKQWGLNINNFDKVERIIQYFYIDKKFNSTTYKGEKYFVDGIIEEWKFSDNEAATKASIDLGAKQEMVYIDRGGFVCHLDNYMYAFHSRASNFIYSIKPLFKKFVSNNKATNTTIRTW